MCVCVCVCMSVRESSTCTVVILQGDHVCVCRGVWGSMYESESGSGSGGTGGGSGRVSMGTVDPCTLTLTSYRHTLPLTLTL